MGMVYEALLLFGPLLLIGFVYSISVDLSDKASPESLAVKRAGLQLVLACALVAYFAWGWSKGRCTLPMQTLGLQLQTTDGQPLTTQRAVVRAIAAAPSVFLGIGFLYALVDANRQMLHDRIAGTRLAYVPVGRAI
jgi:uncharacterized RDD family membrane protein YckC